MATITININDTLAEEFRKKVKEKLGERKGALGKAVEAALKEWLHEEEQKKIGEEMIALMEEGIDLGGIKIKSRAELYDRK